MKKLALILCMILALSLFACDSAGNNAEDTKAGDESEKNEETADPTEAWREIFMFSDDERLCFMQDTSTVNAVYYEGDKITGYRQYVNMGTASQAEDFAQQLNDAGYDDDMNKISAAGKLLIFEYSEKYVSETFGNMTLDGVRDYFKDCPEIVK